MPRKNRHSARSRACEVARLESKRVMEVPSRTGRSRGRRDSSSSKSEFLARKRAFQAGQGRRDADFEALLDRLDAQLLRLQARASLGPGAQGTQAAHRHLRIRAKQWAEKLSEPVSNAEWKQNRNEYARLLVEQVSNGRLAGPLAKMPPAEPLDTLPRHLRVPKSGAFAGVGNGAGAVVTGAGTGAGTGDGTGAGRHINFGGAMYEQQRRHHWQHYEQSTHGDFEGSVAESKLDGGQSWRRRLDEQAERIEVLEQELASEQALRRKERARLAKLHSQEMNEIRRLHVSEMEALMLGTQQVPEAEAATAPGSTDDQFLAYLEDFQAKATRMISSPKSRVIRSKERLVTPNSPTSAESSPPLS